METVYTTLNNPLVQGIKVIGIGKHGSKPLSADQIEEIAQYLTEEPAPVAIQKGAFLGSLLAKGVTPEEEKLLYALANRELSGVADLYDILCPDAPASMREIGIKLLSINTLSRAEAKQLGDFLYSDELGETFRGMAASMLRIRYETDEEYNGLMDAAETTYTQDFRQNRTFSGPLVQLTEPFDGVEHSYMITPLLAQAMQEAGYTALVSLSRSSGPKLTLDSLDIYKALHGSFLQGIAELNQPQPIYGWALDQKLLSPALDKWVERRHLIFKRPFLATLEEVLNPCRAEILITSVFHLTYIEKMIRLGGMAGFKAVIVMKRGLEGTLAPALSKANGITCAVFQPDGSFITQTYEASSEEFSAFRAESDDVVTDLTLEENIRLIQQFSQQGSTGNTDFDKRVNLGTSLYQKGLQWIKQHLS